MLSRDYPEDAVFDLDLYLMGTIFALMFGAIIFITDSILPVLSIILSVGTVRGEKSGWGIFTGFIFSFAFFRIILSLLVKATEISFETLQYVGIFVLILYGLLMIFPQYSPWKISESGFKNGVDYGVILGFIWSFWVGLFNILFTDDFNIREVDVFVVYTTFLSCVPPGLILVALNYILSKLYPSQYDKKIDKVLGCLTILTALLIAFHVINITPRVGLKVEDRSPPVKLHELFNLK